MLAGNMVLFIFTITWPYSHHRITIDSETGEEADKLTYTHNHNCRCVAYPVARRKADE